MRKQFLLLFVLIFSACTPQVAVTSEVTVTLLPSTATETPAPPTYTATPTPVVFPAEKLATMDSSEIIAAAPEVTDVKASAYIGHNEVGYVDKDGNLVKVWQADTGEIIDIPEYLQSITPDDIKKEVSSVDELLKVDVKDLGALAKMIRFWVANGELPLLAEDVVAYKAILSDPNDKFERSVGVDVYIEPVLHDTYQNSVGMIVIEDHGKELALAFPTIIKDLTGAFSVLNKSYLWSNSFRTASTLNQCYEWVSGDKPYLLQPMRIYVGERISIDTGKPFSVDGCKSYALVTGSLGVSEEACRQYWNTSHEAYESKMDNWIETGVYGLEDMPVLVMRPGVSQ